MIRPVLEELLAGRSLGPATMEECFTSLMAGEWSQGEQAAFLVALRAKGEAPEEIAAAARVLRRAAMPVTSSRQPMVDTCGTGGDGSLTLNISTGAALVAAACGVAVAKHGNRSVSSRCGSADVVEALGLPLEVAPHRLGQMLDDPGFAFLFAPLLHPAMRAVMSVRQTLAVRTVFNLLGPLANPAGVRRQVVGVYHPAVMPLMAGALAQLDAERAWVVHSDDGLDELSVCAPTRVMHVETGQVEGTFTVDPERLGLRDMDAREMAGGDAAANATRLRDILAGEEWSTAAAAVALNAAAALVVAGAEAALATALRRTRECLAAGAGLRLLGQAVERAGGGGDGF